MLALIRQMSLKNQPNPLLLPLSMEMRDALTGYLSDVVLQRKRLSLEMFRITGPTRRHDIFAYVTFA